MQKKSELTNAQNKVNDLKKDQPTAQDIQNNKNEQKNTQEQIKQDQQNITEQ